MSTCTVIGADIRSQVDSTERQKKDITVHFGIFFDGTGNQRIQVNIGKMFRAKGKINEIGKQEQWLDDFSLDGLPYSLKESLKEQYGNDVIDDFQNAKLNVENEYSRKEERRRIWKRIWSYYLEEGKRNDLTRGNDYSNIAILERFFNPSLENDSNYYYKIYVTGSGTFANLSKDDSGNGLGFGQGKSGVVQKVVDALDAIKRITNSIGSNGNIGKVNYLFYLFGFSRGATEARLFVDICSNYRKANRPPVLYKIIKDYRCDNKKQQVTFPHQEGSPIQFPFIGIYDTVSSVGVNLNSRWNPNINVFGSIGETISNVIFNVASKSFDSNIADLGLNTMVKCNDVKVGKIVHICALDEYRENFSLVAVPLQTSNGAKVDQIFIPGAHADVGGGYLDGYSGIIIIASSDYQTIYGRGGNNAVLVQSGDTSSPLVYYRPLYIQHLPSHIMSSKHTAKRYKITVENLTKMGWIDEYDIESQKMMNESPLLIELNRKTNGGYSYWPLCMMKEKCDELKLFDDTITKKFMIPNSLKRATEQWKSGNATNCNSEYGIAYYPQDENHYKLLRKVYLHFSSDLTTTKGVITVNGPNYDNNYIMMRNIYDDTLRLQSNVDDKKNEKVVAESKREEKMSNENDDAIKIYGNYTAVMHYFMGNGKPAKISDSLVETAKLTSDFINNHNKIVTGELPSSGYFSVDMKKTISGFFIGNTLVYYEILPDKETVKYKFFVNKDCDNGKCQGHKSDAFEDPNFIAERYSGLSPRFKPDGKGPNLELGGVPYDFISPLQILPLRKIEK